MVVAEANLILVEWRLLTNDQLIRFLGQLSDDTLGRHTFKVAAIILECALSWTLQRERLLVAGMQSCLDDAGLEVGRHVVLLVHYSLRKSDHLFLDDSYLPMVLQQLDEGLATDGRRVVLAGKLEAHVGC